jgi:fumarate reductase flavoprotein subunit
MNKSYDLVIVGAGGSGLAAAARGAELGLSVALLEKQPQPGGTTGIAVGSFTANRTKHQYKAGVQDTLEAHTFDASQFAPADIECRNNDSLRSYFLSESAQTLDWLSGMGLVFHGPSPEPPNRVPRMHNVVPNAKAYIAALQAKLIQCGGELICNASVVELEESNRRVTGVIVEEQKGKSTYLATRGVVLAAGDYANSLSLIERFKGAQFGAIEGINKHAQGDGHRLAEQVGAKLVNMDVTYGPELRFVPPPSRYSEFTQLLPAGGIRAFVAGKLLPLAPKALVHAFVKRLLVTWQHPEDRLFAEGAILINRRGERFCDESTSPEREIAVANQPRKEAFVLLDERLMKLFSQWPNFISTAPEIAYAYVSDYLRLRPDVAIKEKSLEGLCDRREIPLSHLEDSVSVYNRERESRGLPPLSGSEWVLLGPLRAYFTTTEGGTAINHEMQVLDSQDQPIPGLYAIGQNGLGGQILWGHGLHIAWAITSGRIAAEVLAGTRRQNMN